MLSSRRASHCEEFVFMRPVCLEQVIEESLSVVNRLSLVQSNHVHMPML